MQCVMVSRTGGPDVLCVEERQAPVPTAGQVLVDVRVCGVNFIDIYEREGQYPVPVPFIPGSEGAGVVAAVESGPSDVAVGDRVAWANVPGGGYASQVVLPAERVVPVPDEVDDETAVALMLQGLTAHYLCFSSYAVQPGDHILVHAAAGGVGALLTQMVRLRGGHVIATTSTSAKAALAREAGAEHVIDYTRRDVAAEVRRLTGGRGVAAVYDGVGRSTFEASLDSLRVRGTLVLYGAASGPVPPLDPQVLNSKGSLYLTRPTLIHHIADRAELLERACTVFGLATDGSLEVHIGGRYPLTAARQAHEDLASRRTSGKLLLLPG
ncbi:MAG TPA: quinone oxidoreductase [Actinomycetales bacterium]|nr:quinone oxidoreductase [Actinomycetales bacterium]